MEKLEDYLPTQEEYKRNLECYKRMIDRISKHGIKFLGVSSNGHTVDFEKDGKKFGHAISTWQCAADPERPGITEDDVVGWVIKSFKNRE